MAVAAPASASAGYSCDEIGQWFARAPWTAAQTYSDALVAYGTAESLAQLADDMGCAGADAWTATAQSVRTSLADAQQQPASKGAVDTTVAEPSWWDRNGDTVATIVGAAVAWALFGVLAGVIARGKGRSFGPWWTAGTLLGVLVLVPLLLLRAHRCPWCGETVAPDALICRSCRSPVNADSIDVPRPAV